MSIRMPQRRRLKILPKSRGSGSGDIRLGRFVRGVGLSGALRAELRVQLGKWGAGQMAWLVEAYSIGGHHGGGRRGPKWAPRKQRYRWPLLRKTGAMRSATKKTLRGSNQHGAKISFFNTAPYAKYHQLGTSKMVARPILVITPVDLGHLKTRLTKWANKRINGKHRKRRVSSSPRALPVRGRFF